VLTGSVIVWPIADVYFGPKVISLGMAAGAGVDDRPPLSVAGRFGEPGQQHSREGTITLAGCGQGKELARQARASGAPVVYISLREATSTHNFFICFIEGLYSSQTLGSFGTLCQSVGTWWVVLCDVLIADRPEHSRCVHLAVCLRHLHRANAMAAHSLQRRPVVVFDHVDVALAHARGAAESGNPEAHHLRSMLVMLGAFAAAASHDDNCDLTFCADDPSVWRRALRGAGVRPSSKVAAGAAARGADVQIDADAMHGLVRHVLQVDKTTAKRRFFAWA